MMDTKEKFKDKIDDTADKAKKATENVADAAKAAAKKVGQKLEDVGIKIKAPAAEGFG